MKVSTTRAVVGIAALSLTLTGCGLDQHPPYSSNVKYGLRKDPIIRDGKEMGDERYEPDRPGLMPIMKLEEMRDPDHPYYPKSSKLDDKFIRDPRGISAKDQKDLEDALEGMFGTPAAPKVNAKEAGLDEKALLEFKLDDATLAMGSTRYRIHCLHCHGVTGDGRGPTARWINPHPRDFRPGSFKFASVNRTVSNNRPPSRADLLRTLRQGLEGTAMPSFNLLADDELESLVSYVIHLSIRGQVERTLMTSIFEPAGKDTIELKLVEAEEGGPEDVKAKVKERTKLIGDIWLVANRPSSAIKVAPYPYDEKADNYYTEILPKSVKRGQQIFNGTPSNEFKDWFAKRLKETTMKGADDAAIAERAKSTLETGAKCVTCHIDYGRQAKYKYDEWGTLVRPNNLTLGVLRGGKRPVDIYYRIHSGIPGLPMTPFGDVPFQGNEDLLWDVVNFVTVLPYPKMRESLGVKID